MNAHHRKASYRPPPPTPDTRTYSAAQLLTGATPTSRLTSAIRRVPYGWQLDAIIPHNDDNNDNAAAAVVSALQGIAQSTGTAQLALNVNLAHLLDIEFLNAHIRQGHLVALSLDDGGGQDADIVCLDGRGRLVLSVTKDTYECLGLPGRASAFGSHRQRYIIEIDLKAPHFRAGKPGFERTKQALAAWPARTDLLDELAGQPARREPKRFDLLCSFVDSKGEPQPVHFSDSSKFICSTIPTAIDLHTLTDIAVPLGSAFPDAPSTSSSADQPNEEENKNKNEKKRRRLSSGSFRLASSASDDADDDDPAQFWQEYREWAGLASLGGGGGGGGESTRDKLGWRGKEGGGAGADDEDDDDQWGVPREQCRRGNVSVMSATGFFHPVLLAQQIEHLVTSETLAAIPFLSLSLRPFAHSPISHTSSAAAEAPNVSVVVGTSKKPNGKKRKRGRGRGEEEEADSARLAELGGWELVVRRGRGTTGEEDEKLEWHLWEMP
ncbi:hypothetical protein JCM8115_001726 [Rhodotorula mucilaginosa]